jgi:hypothetical protein
MERVVGAVHHMQRGARPKRGTDRTEQLHIGQRVTRALEKQHRRLHPRQVRGALDAGTACRM